MSTRGAYGFVKNKEMKITYNHYDSYLEGLGLSVIKFIANTTDAELNKIFDKIIMVNEDSIPTQEQIKECEKVTNLNVSSKSVNDWYCLLRNAQGNLEEYKNDLRYMIDNKEFMGDSLFCEFAYILNLDDKRLEIYKGFNKDKETDNDYTQFRVTKDNYEYVEVEIFDSISFDNIRKLVKGDV